MSAQETHSSPPDPDDLENARIVAQGKANLATAASSLRFWIEEVQTDRADPDDELPIAAPRVKMLGESERTSADLLQTDHRRDPRDGAMRWLVSALGHGPVPAQALRERGEAAGQSCTTLRRARDDLGIVKDKVSFGGGWEWRLPREEEVRLLEGAHPAGES